MGPKATKPQPPDCDAEQALTALGQFMSRRNQELGLTVVAVCQRVGMSRASWYRIARGESGSPAHRLLEGLARVYRVRASHLFALATQVNPLHAQFASPWPSPVDALWRCQHPKRFAAGRTLEVAFELLNLSGEDWCGARISPTAACWLALPEAPQLPLSTMVAAASATTLPNGVQLEATAAGQWARLRVQLQTPPLPGRYLCCWTLQNKASGQPSAVGFILCIEVE